MHLNETSVIILLHAKLSFHVFISLEVYKAISYNLKKKHTFINTNLTVCPLAFNKNYPYNLLYTVVINAVKIKSLKV